MAQNLLIQDFLNYIKQHHLFQPKDRLLLAISGGVDSIVLAHLCKTAGYEVELMHVNFQLRGEESQRDENFVQQFAKELKLKLHLKRVDTEAYAQEHRLSIQVAARDIRYAWFEDIRKSYSDKPTWIVTAHHVNDSIETSLFNWVKGTGIRGLTGIPNKRGAIVRPLLFAKKERLVEYANQNNLKWVEDSSNQKVDYSRNLIRHKLIPLLKELHPQAETNLENNLQRFSEAALLQDQALNVYRKKLLVNKNGEWRIPVEALKQTKPLTTVFFELLRPFNFLSSQMGDLEKLLQADSGKFVTSSTHRCIRHRNWLIIAAQQTEDVSICVIDGEGEFPFASGSICVTAHTSAPSHFSDNPAICFVPQRLIEFPLVLRRCKTGDYFYPLGMRHKKKLARFFIDQKLSKTKKENQWVLEQNGKIIWVAGLRLDDRFKVTSSESPVFKIEWTK